MNRKDSALQHKQFAFKAGNVSDDGTFDGYGSVFGNVDSYGEIVAPGAFADSLKLIKASGDPLPALWQHNSNQPIGGYDVLEEDERGLKVAGWLLTKEIPLAAQAHALMKRRVVKGLSIGYYVDSSTMDEKTGIRTLNKLDLREISIVTFPANAEAQIDAVKSRLDTCKSLKEIETLLREAGGFSRADATSLVGRIKTLTHGERDVETKAVEEMGALLAGFRL